MYADDLLLVSLSIHDLQAIIDICCTEFLNLDMKINFKKSSCMRIGKRHKLAIPPPSVGLCPIHWTNELQYLGMTFIAEY